MLLIPLYSDLKKVLKEDPFKMCWNPPQTPSKALSNMPKMMSMRRRSNLKRRLHRFWRKCTVSRKQFFMFVLKRRTTKPVLSSVLHSRKWSMMKHTKLDKIKFAPSYFSLPIYNDTNNGLSNWRRLSFTTAPEFWNINSSQKYDI